MLTAKITGLKEVSKGLFSLPKHKVAQVNTINKLATLARAGSQSRINSDYNIPSEIPANQKNLAIEKADKATMEALVIGSKKRMRLGAFPAEDTPKGVKVSVKRGRGSIAKQRGNDNKSFLGTPAGRDWTKYGQKRTSEYGKRLVLIRRVKGSYPTTIKGMAGPSMGGLLTRKDNIAAVNRMMAQRSELILQDEMRQVGIK